MKKRKSTRRRTRRRRRRRKSRKRRRRGAGKGDFRPKMPPACAKEKKIIKDLRKELALRTPLGPRGTRIHGSTPETTPRSRSVWYQSPPRRTGRPLAPHGQRLTPPSPLTPETRGGRRRTRRKFSKKRRGGMNDEAATRQAEIAIESVFRGMPPQVVSAAHRYTTLSREHGEPHEASFNEMKDAVHRYCTPEQILQIHRSLTDLGVYHDTELLREEEPSVGRVLPGAAAVRARAALDNRRAAAAAAAAAAPPPLSEEEQAVREAEAVAAEAALLADLDAEDAATRKKRKKKKKKKKKGKMSKTKKKAQEAKKKAQAANERYMAELLAFSGDEQSGGRRSRTRRKQFGRGWKKNNNEQFQIIQRPAAGWANIPAGRILIKYKTQANQNPGVGQHNVDGNFQLVNGFFRHTDGRQFAEADVLKLIEWEDVPDLVSTEDEAGEIMFNQNPHPFGGGRRRRKQRGGVCAACLAPLLLL